MYKRERHENNIYKTRLDCRVLPRVELDSLTDGSVLATVPCNGGVRTYEGGNWAYVTARDRAANESVRGDHGSVQVVLEKVLLNRSIINPTLDSRLHGAQYGTGVGCCAVSGVGIGIKLGVAVSTVETPSHSPVKLPRRTGGLGVIGACAEGADFLLCGAIFPYVAKLKTAKALDERREFLHMDTLVVNTDPPKFGYHPKQGGPSSEHRVVQFRISVRSLKFEAQIIVIYNPECGVLAADDFDQFLRRSVPVDALNYDEGLEAACQLGAYLFRPLEPLQGIVSLAACFELHPELVAGHRFDLNRRKLTFFE